MNDSRTYKIVATTVIAILLWYITVVFLGAARVQAGHDEIGDLRDLSTEFQASVSQAETEVANSNSREDAQQIVSDLMLQVANLYGSSKNLEAHPCFASAQHAFEDNLISYMSGTGVYLGFLVLYEGTTLTEVAMKEIYGNASNDGRTYIEALTNAEKACDNDHG